jgi:hypothetical protein
MWVVCFLACRTDACSVEEHDGLGEDGHFQQLVDRYVLISQATPALFCEHSCEYALAKEFTFPWLLVAWIPIF